MTQNAGNNYYKLLEVNPGSSLDDIEEGYRRAVKVYGEDSDALYSLYSTEERKSMLNLINAAYETLTDPAKKKAYDESLLYSETVDEPETREVDLDSLRGAAKAPSRTSQVLTAARTAKLKKPLLIHEINPIIVEQYRLFYSKLEEITLKKNYKVLSFTSTVKGEGKSVNSFNISYLMADEFRKKTILVECDLRKPSTVLGNLEETEGHGLVDVLNGERDLYSTIIKVEGTSLYILPAGNYKKKTPDLMGTPLKAVMEALKSEFDYVIVDSPPILPLADMSIISKLVDGIVLVVRAGQAPKDLVLKGLNSITGGNFIGVVLNGAESRLQKYYY